ncbi:DNA methyltransferase [Halopenitus persicus]|uniref:Type II methyltransferase n=1 Tax=Halopenitus persicus TaxID=1048396 RepID=A0A1H3DTC2_9EURY|nr:DNA methyltransferase [Halopenitus persicus]SDX69782.1 DNA methylase [Halopenitus persicus]
MRTFRTLPADRPDPDTLPDWCDVDVRSIPAVPEWCIETFTDPGDAVIDPFAGFGTTIAAADRLGRAGYGIERDPRRVAYVRERVDHPRRVVVGDAREGRSAFISDATGDQEEFISSDGSERKPHINADDDEEDHEGGDVDPPAFDLCCTAPPFMLDWMDTDPFEGYESAGSYGAYLADATAAFEAVADLLAPEGIAVVEVSNVRFGPGVSTLAWDLADAIDDAAGLRFRTEIVLGFEDGDIGFEDDASGDDGDRMVDAAGDDRTWGPETGRYGYGYDHCYCLVFDHVS